MKNVLRTAVFTAAAAAATLVPASAEQMEVKIPFAFEAGGRNLPAGNYTVQRLNGTVAAVAYKIANPRGELKALVISSSHAYAASAAEPARLVFECATSGCRMTELWNGSTLGDRFHYKPLPREQEAKTVAVHFTSVGAE